MDSFRFLSPLFTLGLLLGAFSLLAIGSPPTWATSIAEPIQSLQAQPSCRVKARYLRKILKPFTPLRHSSRNTRTGWKEFSVSWQFSVEESTSIAQGKCPPSSVFVLSLPEGRVVRTQSGEELERFPPHIKTPRVDQKVVFNVLFIEPPSSKQWLTSRWLVQDWNHRFELQD